jgi:hypothetical protein
LATMNLTFSLLPDGSNQLSGFSHFWLFYVRGFSPQFHCQKSLKGSIDQRFHRKMELGQSFELLEPGKYDYIYLCGVTPAKFEGLHLALKPEEGAYAETVTYNGLKITVTHARELLIPDLPDGFASMPHNYTSCRNWQFGGEYYGLGN